MPPNVTVVNLDGDLSPAQIRARALYGLRRSAKKAGRNYQAQLLQDDRDATPRQGRA
jgi:hypothetical protein